MTKIDVDSKTFTKRVLHDGEADATGKTGTEAEAEGKREWMDADENGKPDEDEDGGEED